MTARPAPLPQITIIAPAHNEQDNVTALINEIDAALSGAGIAFEVIIVDDGSTDRTRAAVQELMPTRPWLRCIAMQRTPQGKGHGQSAAFCAGFRAARAPIIGTLDADLQNDPADFPRLLQIMRETGADMVQGDRSRARRDNFVRRRTSAIGRLFRRMILNDKVRDTGCSLRVMTAELARRLPLEFKGVHRFFPAIAQQMGYTVVETPVNHRPRTAGETKYGLGIWQRALPGLRDCFAVRWMGQRRKITEALEVVSPTTGALPPGAHGLPALPASAAEVHVLPPTIVAGAPERAEVRP